VRLPRAEKAVIDPAKLRDYVLSPQHPVGRFKATFFAQLGYSTTNWVRLDLELRRLAMEGTAELAERNSFGQKYVVRGRIVGQAGRTANVVSVWIILNDEDIPRFVTVFPGAHS
jgi:uncharacterized protein DUF6883